MNQIMSHCKVVIQITEWILSVYREESEWIYQMDTERSPNGYQVDTEWNAEWNSVYSGLCYL